MPARLDEVAQKQVVEDLRNLIDNAMRDTHQSPSSVIAFANRFESILKTPYAARNLGGRRWAWLTEHGFAPVGEEATIEGINARKATITPEVLK